VCEPEGFPAAPGLAQVAGQQRPQGLPAVNRQVKADIAEIRMARRGPQEVRAMPADENRRPARPGGARVTGGVVQLVPAAAEGATAAPQDPHDLDRFPERGDPLPRGRPADPECRGVGGGTARAQAQDDPPAGQRVERGRHLSHHRRMAVRIGQDHRHRDQLLCNRRERG
jgi:hypothetical protein